ncbi:MAG: ABC transporter ATP-binding protein [Acidimicrobiia bacterium]
MGLRRGAEIILDGVDLDVAAGETVAVIGPSGCGKTSLLRVIAGLEAPDAGTVSWSGADLAGVPPHLREVGFVFQDYALFPHMDVAANVAFGLRMRHLARDEMSRRVGAALDGAGLAALAHRRVDRLSGGEQQRVALARALVIEPRLLLLDEPLGALDRTLKTELLSELGGLLAGRTTVLVTHDQAEAFALADRVVVMRAGAVVQAGEPEAVWRQPADEWVARFCGLDTVVGAVVASGEAVLPWGTRLAYDGPGTEVRVVVHPGTFRIAGPGERGDTVAATVRERRFAGSSVSLAVRVADVDVDVEVDPLVAVGAGDSVRLRVDPAGLTILDPEAGPLPEAQLPRGSAGALPPNGSGPAGAAGPTGSAATGSRGASRAP